MGRSFKAVMLHGFLGSSADWSLVLKALETKGIAGDVLAPDFFRPGPLSAEHDFEEWTGNLLAEAERRFNGEQVHLLGYSLGGRLALHAAFARPSRWKSLWIFSSNPGILFAPSADRVKWERETAGKFMEMPWDKVMKEWNQLDVFSRTAPRILPKEDQFERRLLAKSLTGWSVTKHRFTISDIQSLPMPIHWWFGENDLKFLDVKSALERQNIRGSYRIAPKAGHRITLDRPDLIADALAELVGDSE